MCDSSLPPKCIHYAHATGYDTAFSFTLPFSNTIHTHTSLLPAPTHLTVQNDTVPMRASLGQVILDVCNLAKMKQTLFKHSPQRSRVRGQRSGWIHAGNSVQVLYMWSIWQFHHCLGTIQYSPQEEVQKTMVTPPPPQGPQVYKPYHCNQLDCRHWGAAD